MCVRWPLLAVVLGLGISYVAYPYVTLYRLGVAIRSGDAYTLREMVDWPSVREGIKEDICDSVLDAPAADSNHQALPPFGASFVRGIAANAIDRAVTAEALVQAVHVSTAAAATPAHATPPTHAASPAHAIPAEGADVHVGWAFFADPTTFDVSLRAAGQPDSIRLQLELRNGRWQVRRVWLPESLLAQANAHTRS